jgi:hypothetical protein
MAVNAWSSSDFFTLRRVTRLMMVVCLLSLCACAGQREAPPGTPEWVREGQGPAIADGRRYLYGIGVVGKMKSRVLMRAAADNKAKNKLGRAVDDYVDALMAAYGTSSQAAGRGRLTKKEVIEHAHRHAVASPE